jgi:hypothetical protein
VVHLVLEDGRGFWRSTVVMSGVYHLIAAAVDASHAKFKRWLEDMSNRPVPFMDFDLRGLPERDRDEFHRAAKVARDKLLVEINAGRISANAVEPFETLVCMKERMDRGEPPLSLSDDKDVQVFHGFVCDLDEIWEG